MTQRQTDILVILGTSVMCVCMVASLLFMARLSPTRSVSAPSDGLTQRSSPTAPILAPGFADILDSARRLTELNRNNYYASLVGRGVRWIGTVADVTDEGDIDIRITSDIGYDVILQGIPKETGAAIRLGQSIEIKGTITGVSDMFGSGNPIITVKASPTN